MTVPADHGLSTSAALDDVRQRIRADAPRWTGAIALAYAPDSVTWLRVGAEGELVGPSGAQGSSFWSRVWELTVFTPGAQVRWVHDHAGVGTVDFLDDQTARDLGLQPLDGRSERLLWGACTGRTQEGWAEMVSLRVKDQWVPIDGPAWTEQRVVILAVEYTSRDKHGNVAVAAERLTGLRRCERSRE